MVMHHRPFQVSMQRLLPRQSATEYPAAAQRLQIAAFVHRPAILRLPPGQTPALAVFPEVAFGD